MDELIKTLEPFCGTRVAKEVARNVKKHRHAVVTILYNLKSAISAIETEGYQAKIVRSSPSGTIIRISRQPRAKHQA